MLLDEAPTAPPHFGQRISTREYIPNDGHHFFHVFRLHEDAAASFLNDFPAFKKGRTLPLKFKVVDLSDVSKKKKPKTPTCEKGPYLGDLTIALSVTRILKPEGGEWVVTSDLVKPVPSGKGYIDEFGRAIFDESGNKFHFNWRLNDLPDGPGIYELFIIPDDSNFSPAIEYVYIK